MHHKEGPNFIILIILIACRKTSLAHPLCGFVFLKKCLYKFKSQSFFLSKNVLYKNFILHFHVHIKFIFIFWEARISLSFNIFCCFSAFLKEDRKCCIFCMYDKAHFGLQSFIFSFLFFPGFSLRDSFNFFVTSLYDRN